MTEAQAPGGVERRQHPRAKVCATAVVLARYNNGVVFTIESISIGGACLVGPLTLIEEERIQILFEIDDHPIDVVGEVIRADRQDIVNDRVIVRFIDAAADTRERIRSLVLRTLEDADEGNA